METRAHKKRPDGLRTWLFQLDGAVKSLHKKWLEITKHPLKEGGNAFTALDGSEIRQTSWGWWYIPCFTGVALHPRWLFGISSINSIIVHSKFSTTLWETNMAMIPGKSLKCNVHGYVCLPECKTRRHIRPRLNLLSDQTKKRTTSIWPWEPVRERSLYSMRHAKNGQFQGAHSELLWIEALLHHLFGLGPCWHPTPPEVGQLQDAHSELLCKEALLHQMFGLGPCWHRTQPAPGQLQGAHSDLLRREASVHRLSGLGLCWHRTPTRNRTTSRCPWWAAIKRGVAPLSVRPWPLSAPDWTRNWTTSRWPWWAATMRGVPPSFVRPWSMLAPDSTRNRTTSRCPFSSCYV